MFFSARSTRSDKTCPPSCGPCGTAWGRRGGRRRVLVVVPVAVALKFAQQQGPGGDQPGAAVRGLAEQESCGVGLRRQLQRELGDFGLAVLVPEVAGALGVAEAEGPFVGLEAFGRGRAQMATSSRYISWAVQGRNELFHRAEPLGDLSGVVGGDDDVGGEAVLPGVPSARRPCLRRSWVRWISRRSSLLAASCRGEGIGAIPGDGS